MRKIAVITGASSGMGECFARQIASDCKKFNVSEIWIIARRTDRLENLKSEIENDEIKVKAVTMDVSGQKGTFNYKALLENEKDFEITLLVNNAGFGTYGEFSNTDTVREMEMIDLNCTSLTGITGFSIPFMTKGSRIINVASLAGYGPLGNFAVYGATKAYVLSFSIAIAAELKPKGIKVTALCPGSVSTEFANVASKGARKEVLHGKSAEKTVKDALKKSYSGKMISMWALKWKINAFLCKVMPARLIAWATFTFSKRPSN